MIWKQVYELCVTEIDDATCHVANNSALLDTYLPFQNMHFDMGMEKHIRGGLAELDKEDLDD